PVLAPPPFPPPGAAPSDPPLPRLGRDLVALGVVAVHDPGLLRPNPRLDGPQRAYGNLADAGRLAVRVNASIRSEALEFVIARGLRSGDGLGADAEGRARLGWLKLFA